MEKPWESRARWIWLPGFDDTRNPGAVVLFRKTFCLTTVPSRFVIRVTADSRYKLRLNNQLISLGPCKGTVDHWYFERVDVADVLQAGVNVLAAEVLRYSPQHRGNISMSRSYTPGFLLLGEEEPIEGEETNRIVVASDLTWRCVEDKSIQFINSPLDHFLSINETVDGTKRHFGWEDVSFDDSAWSMPVELVNAAPTDELTTLPWNLNPREIPLLTSIPGYFKSLVVKNGESRLQPDIRLSDTELAPWNDLLQDSKPLTIPSGSHIVVDLAAPEYSTGYIQLQVSGGAGATIRLLCAESYERAARPSPDVYLKGDRTDFMNGVLNGIWDCYLVAGKTETETYQTWWRRSFRFVRLEIITTSNDVLHLHQVSYTESTYPLEVRSTFESSVPRYENFWTTSLRTLKNCMHETYEDCPFYEQTQFPFDTRSQILFTYLVSGDDRLARKAIHDLHCSLRPDGLIAMRSPAHMNHSLPVFSLSFIHMISDHVLFFGDQELARRYLPTCLAILGYYDRLVRWESDGLVGPFDARAWSYVDWVKEWTFGTPPAARTGPATYFSLVYALALGQMAEIADFLNQKELARDCIERREALLSSVNTHCLNETRTFYLDGPGSREISQHCQVYAVLAGAIKGPAAQSLLRRTLSTAMPQMSYAQALYLFRALHKVDLYSHTISLWSAWDEMLSQGLDTWAEMPFDPRSDCHAWSAVPLSELPCGILGIQPTAPACASIEIRPMLSMVASAKGGIVTPRGVLMVQWSRGNNSFKLRVDVPSETKVDIFLPSGQKTYQDESVIEVDVDL
ncbi:hypothetical protein ASPZODRAFT_77269 [Penicilliopsis zonata CBS 506.65]|uniref:Alpha-L-rhamnosidase n=1 Tax=Penicilliopsis zonata CBS 506.65 TaxID=1073090 RepID=A0A1L9S546_9EURO|nr:hypothetical protein ASPZODRAFT_77269 [Penicilliopsis zonata CBS 506.65]OJJ42278.1 hypothetical protein ASPZODRAFT_77269 [Penicilliopsis zonata CBS 506.65]